jgi:hypothetical protein
MELLTIIYNLTLLAIFGSGLHDGKEESVITIESKGSFKNTEAFLNRMKTGEVYSVLNNYGQRGVQALRDATPIDTTETANSWYYEIVRKNGQYSIIFKNSHMAGNIPVAILIQYGHGTRTGGYVEGRDFINPAIRPIFDQIAADVWRAVTK